MSLLSLVAQELNLPKEVLEAKMVKAFLNLELMKIRGKKQLIIAKYSKYGVKTLSDLLKLVEDGVISDVNAHDDIDDSIILRPRKRG